MFLDRKEAELYSAFHEMDVLQQIMTGLEEGREIYLRLTETPGASVESLPDGQSELFLGDNIEYMKQLLDSGYGGKFSLIYIDPPFFTRSKFNAAVSVKSESGRHRIRHLAFDDRFERSLECYIENMTVRLMLMRDLLADDGLLWIHLDWHSSHYVRLVLDTVMGVKNFVNEIIWCYKSGGSGKRHFSRKHDTILVYGKTSKYYIDIPEEKSYNRGFKPYHFKGVKEFCDENGWYTMVNMKDVWNVDMVGRTSAERNGYATQKPVALMKRIIEAGSREGDLVGDFFCGSGSFPAAAEAAGRRWAACDNEKLAVSLARKRLLEAGARFAYRQTEREAAGTGVIDVDVTDIEECGKGRYMYKCGIRRFIPDIETGYIQKDDRKYVEELIAGDPVQLVDHVIVRSAGESGQETTVINGDFDRMIFVAGSRAAVTAVDVFGGEYEAILPEVQD